MEHFAWLLFVFLVAISTVNCDDEASGQEEAEEELGGWNENPDYEPDRDPCLFGSSNGREELEQVKNELRSLKSAIDGLRSKLDPDFQPKEKLVNDSRCPRGFHYLPKAHSCYKVVYEEHNWTSADNRCKELNPVAHLLAIETKKENDALKRYLQWELLRNSMKNVCLFHEWGDKRKMLWTSGQRSNASSCSGPFVWKLSQTQFNSMSYTNWNALEPNCHAQNEMCLHLRPTLEYTWNDIGCGRRLCPVCEYDPKTEQ